MNADEAAEDIERLGVENATLRAEVERLKLVKEAHYQRTLDLSNDLAAANLQVREMRDVVDAACEYETHMGFGDLNSAYRNRREATDAFVKAVAAYKTRLPKKRKDECGVPPGRCYCGGCVM